MKLKIKQYPIICTLLTLSISLGISTNVQADNFFKKAGKSIEKTANQSGKAIEKTANQTGDAINDAFTNTAKIWEYTCNEADCTIKKKTSDDRLRLRFRCAYQDDAYIRPPTTLEFDDSSPKGAHAVITLDSAKCADSKGNPTSLNNKFYSLLDFSQSEDAHTATAKVTIHCDQQKPAVPLESMIVINRVKGELSGKGGKKLDCTVS